MFSNTSGISFQNELNMTSKVWTMKSTLQHTGPGQNAWMGCAFHYQWLEATWPNRKLQLGKDSLEHASF